MATTTSAPQRATAPKPEQTKQRSLWGDAWRRLISSATGRAGLAITLLLVVIALFIPVLRPYDPSRDRNLRLRLSAPSWTLSQAERDRLNLNVFSTPFGTDELGRDLFIRVLHGSRISLSVGLFAVALAVIFGSLLGLVAGFIGGWFDTVAVWIMDVMLAFPAILLAIAIVSIRGPGLLNTMIAVAIVEIPIFARISRSAVLTIREQEYITAARAVGTPSSRILFRHVTPNSLTPMIVQGTLAIATAIISIAALGFLGLGAQPPQPEWGTMLAGARGFVAQGKWWYPTFPGLAIMLTVLGFNLLGDGLRDALDPRLRK